MLGPAVAGIIIAAGGTAACFMINAVSFLAVLAALALIRPSELYPVDRGDSRPTVFRGVREGLAYAKRTRVSGSSS